MQNLMQNLTHVLITLAVIGAMAALAVTGTISGDLAVTIIAAVGGVSVGGGVASSAASSPVPSSTTVTVPASSASRSNGVTITSTSTDTTPSIPPSTAG